MNPLAARLTRSPLVARVAPFALFLVLTFAQNYFGANGRYWIYFLKTLLGAWMLWTVRGAVEEMRWKVSWEAVVIGVAAFVMWVGLDELLIRLGFANSYPKWKLDSTSWNPNAQFGDGSTLAWFFIGVRVVGASLVVPPLEEVFYRSFVYRYVTKADFLNVPLGAFQLRAFVITSLLFGFEHQEWLAGFLCGLAYQGLVCHKRHLGDAITAHALTNFLLGLWVVSKGAWQFW